MYYLYFIHTVNTVTCIKLQKSITFNKSFLYFFIARTVISASSFDGENSEVKDSLFAANHSSNPTLFNVHHTEYY